MNNVNSISEITEKLKKDPRNRTYTDRGISPIYQIDPEAKVLIIGQAPGRKVEEDGIVKSQKNKEKKTGKSAFSFPLENAPLTGHYHTIKAGTELPNGLEIINDGEPFGEHSKGHYTIYPTEDMLFEEFQKRVSSIETEYGGKKSYK